MYDGFYLVFPKITGGLIMVQFILQSSVIKVQLLSTIKLHHIFAK